MFRIVILTLLCYAFSSIKALETISDDELINLIKPETYLVVLFAKKNCEVSNSIEKELSSISKELADTLSASIVKVVYSQLIRLYTPEKEPAVVFFRKGIPLLYDGPLKGENMLRIFEDNKEPIVKELDDKTFEHLTQASSGATTGDWFVVFSSTVCIECQRLRARLESVGAEIKQRVNIAIVNTDTNGVLTAKRFRVSKVPEFILFRHGKMYRYLLNKYDVKSLASFAKEWYRHVPGESVPAPQSPFDDLIQLIVNFLKENPWVMKLASMTVGVLVIVTVTGMLRKKTEVPQKKDS